jgi:hypothetical protein
MATGMAEDGEAAATISTLAIGALGSDSVGAMEVTLTVGDGLPLDMFGFVVTRITERKRSFDLSEEESPAIVAGH